MSAATSTLAADADQGLGTGELVRPWWRRFRFWIVVAVLLIVTAVLTASFRDTSNSDPLDPDSYTHSGSAAVAQLLHRYGTDVHRTDELQDAVSAGGTVVVPFPSVYDSSQLARLRKAASRLVLIAPTADELTAVGAPLDTIGHGSSDEPGCDWPGARAAGTVDIPDSIEYLPHDGYQLCYGGAVVIADELAVIGAPELLTNTRQANRGVSALVVNAISADRTVTDVTWLMPGDDALQGPAASIWELFPGGVHRGVLYLLLLALLVAIWRGRRFGPVVTEPLPVVVRSAELVEGHGRLYWRARARGRAAAALRAATLHRLGTALGTDVRTVDGAYATVAAAAGRIGWDEARAAAVLLGPIPDTDAGLAALAAELDRLEAAVRPVDLPRTLNPEREAPR